MKTIVLVMLLAALPAFAQSSKQSKKGVTQEQMDRMSCEEQKRAYRESEACFGRYRDSKGKLRAEAFRRCNEVKQPQC